MNSNYGRKIKWVGIYSNTVGVFVVENWKETNAAAARTYVTVVHFKDCGLWIGNEPQNYYYHKSYVGG